MIEFAQSEPPHLHTCAEWQTSGQCEPPCRCACGAVLVQGPSYDTDGRWVWRMADGRVAPFPHRGEPATFVG